MHFSVVEGRVINFNQTHFNKFASIIKINCRADGLAPNAPGGEGNEDGIVGGPRTPQQIAAQKRLQQTQAQVDEVKCQQWRHHPFHLYFY